MKRTILTIVASLLPMLISAQGRGYVSASIESLNHFYVEDAQNSFYPSSIKQLTGNGIYATNNYIKVDYYGLDGRLSVGTQIEGYFPTTIGYPIAKNELTISNLYASWTDKSYSVTAGTFYEQLGSGLLFRSWEDRTLGLNNAMLGARAMYNFKNMFSVKAFWGIPRLAKISEDAFISADKETKFFGLGLSKTNIAAADLSVSLSNIIGWDGFALSFEGSVINKHEKLHENLINLGCKENKIGWSARMNMDIAGFYLKGEYVDVGPQIINVYTPAENGNAQLLELGYNNRGLGISVTGRRVYRMNQRIYTTTPDYSSDANMFSYCPAMCTQYTYMLTTLNPYKPEVDAGEVGGQIDAFYNFRRGTVIGGKRGMRVHANFSMYYNLGPEGMFQGSEMIFWDVSADVEKQWTKKFKMTLLYSAQQYNHDMTTYNDDVVNVGLSHTVVADLLYKWTSTFSTRLELQYQATKGYQKDWMAALLEVSFAPHWSVFASDMYNHGSSKMHYYNAGVSFAMRHLRIAAGYGRYRAGFICSGGVCRQIPAYTGANLTLTASF